MVRLADTDEALRKHLLALECPEYEEESWTAAPPPAERRVALISTAGLHRRGDRPFGIGADDYRVIAGDLPASELVMSHVSTNFDRTGFQQDLNVVLPVDRLNELAEAGEIGSVASYHYSFMGATDPAQMEPVARRLAGLLKQDGVNTVVLLPV
jgi:D-proline reductase (dithiol) PrdB